MQKDSESARDTHFFRGITSTFTVKLHSIVRHKVGRAELGLSCGARFERLAGVFAKRVAIDAPSSANAFTADCSLQRSTELLTSRSRSCMIKINF